ncbi:MAG: precorrin-3B C(17)-methyltransferase [Thermodesulfobacteriota bacterium]
MLYVVGIGPGDLAELTVRAAEAIHEAECIVGYTRYVELIAPLTRGKEIYSTAMTGEVARCEKAIELSAKGRTTAIISSGDAGIYGMAGLVLEILASDKTPLTLDDIIVEVVPGVPAFASAASILGAPLMHDFASISLSDILTPWEVIEERVRAAAKADFVLALYNPRSSKRKEGLVKAVKGMLEYKDPETPVGILRNASREGEEVILTTLGKMHEFFERIDMLTIIIIGNNSTFVRDKLMITPRGYKVI